MSLFTFKTHSKFKKATDLASNNQTDRPIAAIPPSSIRPNLFLKDQKNDPPASQFELEEDDLWDVNEITAEINRSVQKDDETPVKENVESKNSFESSFGNKNGVLEDEKPFIETLTVESPSEADITVDEVENHLVDFDLEPKDVVPFVNNASCSSFDLSPFKSVNHYSKFNSPPKNIGNNSTSNSLADEISRIELKPLNINEETDTWLEDITQNRAFFKISEDTPTTVLENNLKFLNRSYVEILEKAMSSFESISTDILKHFPDFDPDVFMTLRTTKRRIKAKIIQTENILKRAKSSNSTLKTERRDSLITKFLDKSDTPGTVPCTPKKPVETPSPRKSTEKKTSPLKSLRSPLTKTPTKPSRDGDSSFIDYTDLLYKTPLSKASQVKTSIRNDASSSEFDGYNFPHSTNLMEQFRQKFGLRTFRTNQLQVINAALLGHDCFVLMPTGGGKSLCYQLPAVISSGVTVVVSPLRSLILDQVTKLLTLDIPAAHLSGDISEKNSIEVYRKLNSYEPSIKLLYVTPEKLTASTALRNCLAGLYKRNCLARFVIDEVHCVSQWGHDFRPDYKKLKDLRVNYPNVRLMALTATATPRVRTDILHQLQINNPKWFLSSFNRINLTYSVKEKKGKETLKEIANMILKDYRKDTGVIYCFSRKECEDVARELKVYGVDAVAYHAGLPDKQRESVQQRWMNDGVKVVCATIAFGMGIDKVDVRFVIHFSIPKSIEGYYQESGRAGRDGEKAVCILYYSYRDKVRTLRMIHMDRSPDSAAARKIHVDNLFRAVTYAENKTDCRRSLQLEYFGESFNRKICLENRSTACDNCRQQGEYVRLDVTPESKAIVTAIRNICGSDNARGCNYTMLHFVDVFKGASVKKVLNEGHNNIPMYGMGKTWSRLDCERLFRKLIMEDFLKERLMVKDEGITLAYLKAGRRAEELLRGSVCVKLDVKKGTSDSASMLVAENAAPNTDPAILEIHERCFTTLMDVMKGIASAIGCNPNAIMNVQAIRAMSVTLPETAEAMLGINHVTKANFEKYGAALLDITQAFADEKRALMPKLIEPVPPKDDQWFSAGPSSSSSPYFPDGDTDITFMGSSGRGRKRKRNFRRGGSAKRGRASTRGRGSTRGRSASSSTGSTASSSTGRGGTSAGRGVRTAASVKAARAGSSTGTGASQFSTLMELPTSKSRFPRPKVFLSNL